LATRSQTTSSGDEQSVTDLVTEDLLGMWAGSFPGPGAPLGWGISLSKRTKCPVTSDEEPRKAKRQRTMQDVAAHGNPEILKIGHIVATAFYGDVDVFLCLARQRRFCW